MNVLLVYPQIPETFWSFKHALKFASRRAAFPPLGLLTVAAMLPAEWGKKLVDMNATKLSERDLRWADYVFVSAMVAQQDSARDVIRRSKQLGKKVVAGGPLFRRGYEAFGFEDVDHLVIGESEELMPRLVQDIENGCAVGVYEAVEKPDMSRSPVPLWSLVKSRHYEMMNLQYSRGCPFNCEFCDIVVMNGRVPRTKSTQQVIAELDALYEHGWRGSVFFTDDNFIGNKNKLKAEVLPAIIAWNRRNGYRFSFFTEASINLADDEHLMQLMSDAGFDVVFVGIESPNESSLVECNKMPNKGRDLISDVKTIQRHGMQVQGGFIVGFDEDPPSIFRSQINFIQKSGIVSAMVGVLMAPPGTRLYERMRAQGRLLPQGTGNNTDGTTNIVPKMGLEKLTKGYRQVMATIYSPREYYERVRTFLQEFRPRRTRKMSYSPRYLGALLKCLWTVGIRQHGRTEFWRSFLWTLRNKPRCFHLYITFAIQGYHYRRVASLSGLGRLETSQG